MNVNENSISNIKQAMRNDARVTPLGKLESGV